MAETVRVKVGSKQYELSSSQEVFEIVGGKKVKAKRNGDAILRFYGHTIKSRKDYRKSYVTGDNSFDTKKYWTDYSSRYDNRPLAVTSGKPKNGIAEPKDKIKKTSEKPVSAPEISDEIKKYIDEQVKLRTQELETKNEELKSAFKRLEDQLREHGITPVTDSTPEEDGNLDMGIPAENVAIPPKPDERTMWQRTKDKAMSPVVNGHSRFFSSAVRTNYEYDDDGRVIEKIETKDKSRGSKIGAFVLGAAAVGLAWWLYSRHGHGHDIINNYYDNPPAPGKNGVNHTTILSNGSLPSKFDGNEIQTWNGNSNNASVGISLPDNYHLVTDPSGHHDIVKEGSNTIVVDNAHLTNTGALSPDSIQQADSHGLHKIGQEHLTYWDNSGPTLNPGLPSAENPGWNTHTVTVLSES